MINGSMCQSVLSFIQRDTSKDLPAPPPPTASSVSWRHCLSLWHELKCVEKSLEPHVHRVKVWSFPPGPFFLINYIKWMRGWTQGTKHERVSAYTGQCGNGYWLVDWVPSPLQSTLYHPVQARSARGRELLNIGFCSNTFKMSIRNSLNWQLWSHK